jgi:uncharacterized spore protein YtfJ
VAKIQGPYPVIRRLLRARDVFGKPVRSDGVTVIPVASVIGGGGGGEASDANPGPQGGLGYGFVARPVGAFVIRDGKARWRPVIDVTPLAFGAFLAGLVALRWMLKDR